MLIVVGENTNDGGKNVSNYKQKRLSLIKKIAFCGIKVIILNFLHPLYIHSKFAHLLVNLLISPIDVMYSVYK